MDKKTLEDYNARLLQLKREAKKQETLPDIRTVATPQEIDLKPINAPISKSASNDLSRTISDFNKKENFKIDNNRLQPNTIEDIRDAYNVVNNPDGTTETFGVDLSAGIDEVKKKLKDEVVEPKIVEKNDFNDIRDTASDLDIKTQTFLIQATPFWMQPSTSVNGTIEENSTIKKPGDVMGAIGDALTSINNSSYFTPLEMAKMAIFSASTDQKGFLTVKKYRTLQNPNSPGIAEEWNGQVDIDFGERGTNKKKAMLQAKGRDSLLGGIVVKPIDTEVSGEKTVFIPFQFTPDIQEGSYASKYETVEILGRVGALNAYLNTSLPEISITTKYMVTSKRNKTQAKQNPNTDFGGDWMELYDISYLNKIEAIFRAMALPQLNNKDSSLYLAPPVINIVFGDYSKNDYKQKILKGDGSSLGVENLTLSAPKYGNGDSLTFRLKKFICTSVSIKKDYMNNPIVVDEYFPNSGSFNSSILEVSLTLQEVIHSYENYYYDNFDYYTYYMNDFNVLKNEKDSESSLIEDKQSALAGDPNRGPQTYEQFMRKKETDAAAGAAKDRLESDYNKAVTALQRSYGEIQAEIFKETK